MTKRTIKTAKEEDGDIDTNLNVLEVEVEPEERANKRSKTLLTDADEEEEYEVAPVALFHEDRPLQDLNIIHKEKILAFLTSVLHVDIQNSILTDIVFSEGGGELTVVGRASIDGSSKQMNHIIPVLFIKNIINTAVIESNSPFDVMKLLSDKIIVLARNQKGFAISSEKLETPEYSKIAEASEGIHDRSLSTQEGTVYFFSPGKQALLFTSPGKQSKAREEYSLHNAEFLNRAMELFAEAINDHNTATIACEALSRFIFIMCSKGENISFAKEGNTLPYEIRAYNDDDAMNDLNNYRVLQPRELVGADPEIVGGCIRIVNCEGARIKSIPKALKTLDNIIFKFNMFENVNIETITNYNNNHNNLINLANYEGDISLYNTPVSVENYKIALCHHIAKQLYLAFDLKALEDIVFVPEINDDIKVYPSAKGKRAATYSLKNGHEYRSEQLNSAQGYNDDRFFRSKEKDLSILVQKITELFIIGTMPFGAFVTGFIDLEEDFLSTCFHSLLKLASMDHNIEGQNLEGFQESSVSLYNSWIADSPLENESHSMVISVTGETDLAEFLGSQ